MIHIMVLLCLMSDPGNCKVVSQPTNFANTHQCMMLGQAAAAEIMKPYPGYVVRRITCIEDRQKGEDI